MPPTVARSDARAVLEREFTSPILDLEPMPGGNVARIFSFVTDGIDYVIRFNQHQALDFGKEVRIIGMLADTSVPIPPIIRIGTTGHLDYAVSTRAPGETLQSLDPDAQEAIIPEMLALLDRIHQADISATSGYGDFGLNGMGKSQSWRQHLVEIRDDGPAGGFYPSWEQLFASTRLDQSMVDGLFDRLTRLLAFCPEDRWLIHGDYGFDNVLVQDNQITAVIDWLGARFGDFVYDIAWLDFWSDLDFTERFAQHHDDSRQPVPHLRERVRCYQCYMAIDALRFFALSDQADTYAWLADRVQSTLIV